MADKLALLLEAEKRGILPPEKKALLDEARKRGLVHGDMLNVGDTVHPDDVAAMTAPAQEVQTPGAYGDNPMAQGSMPVDAPLPSMGDQVNALGNQVSAGFTAGLNALPIVGPRVLGAAEQLKANVQDRTAEDVAKTDQAQVAENPVPAAIGQVAGNALPFVALGAVPVAAGALGLEGSLGTRLLMGGLSSEAINVGDKSARGADPLSAITEGTQETAAGLPFYALGGRGAKATAVKAVPSVKALRDTAGALYQAAEGSKLVLTQPAAKAFIDGATAKAMSKGLDETLTPGSVAVVKRLQGMADRPMSIQDAMLMRKVAGAAADGSEEKLATDRMIARGIVHDLDNFLEGATKPGSAAVASGNAAVAHSNLVAANSTWAKAAKGKIINTAIDLAASKVASSSGGISLDQALRNEFGSLDRQIINGDLTGFTPKEVKAIQSVAKGSGAQHLARIVGRLAPTPNLWGMGLRAGAGAAAAHALSGGDNPVALGLGIGGLLGAGSLGRRAASALGSDKAEYAGALTRAGEGALGQQIKAARGPTMDRQLPGILGRAGTMTLEQWMQQGGAGTAGSAGSAQQ